MPLQHTTFIESLVAAARSDMRVRGIGLFGSLLSGSADHWSDIDVVIITDREDVLVAVEHQQRFVSSIRGYLVGWRPDYIPVEMWMLLYSPDLHVELKFVHWEQIPKLRHGLKIVWSRTSVEAPPEPEEPAWPPPDVQDLEDQFWIAMNYLRRKCGRGEYFEAAASLDFVRSRILIPLLGSRHQTHLTGYRHLEQRAWPELERLAGTFAMPMASDLERAMSTTIELYLELRDAVAPADLRRHVAAQRMVTGQVKLP